MTSDGEHPEPVHRATKHRVSWAVALVLAAHWGMAVASVRHKSGTFDEIAHLTAGVANWRTGDYRMLPEHPPLAHLWAALPVVAAGFAFPDTEQADWWSSHVWSFGRRFFYELGNDVGAMLLAARSMTAILSAAVGLVVWLWSRRLFGDAGGLLSLGLYAFSPTMLAHGRLVTTDTAVSLFFLLAVGAVWGVLHRVSPATVLLSAVAVAGLLLSKVSGVLIVPMAGVLVVVRLLSKQPTVVCRPRRREVRSRAGQVAVWLPAAAMVSGLALPVIWAAYGFRYPAMRGAVPDRDRFFTPGRLPKGADAWEYQLSGLGRKGRMIAWVRDRKLLPESYLFGLASTVHHAGYRAAFLNGESRVRGWWYFFPYCFLVKTPLPLLGMLLLAAAAAVTRSGTKPAGSTDALSRWQVVGRSLYRTAPLWSLFIVYWVTAVSSNLNIGHRHVLPIYPVLFILCGCATSWPGGGPRWTRASVYGLAVLFVVASLRTWPNYLTYFNALAGGPSNGYRHLVDSSLDWGQDLPGLRTWLGEHVDRADGAARARVYVSYFGTGHPPYYGIEARALPSYLPWERPGFAPLSGGVYCISATMLQQVGLLPECRWTPALEAAYQDLRTRLRDTLNRRQAQPQASRQPSDLVPGDVRFLSKLRFARLCAHLRRRAPDDHVNHSILIYRLSDEDVRRAVQAGPLEQAPDSARNLRRLAEQALGAGSLWPAAVFYRFFLRHGARSAAVTDMDTVAALASSLMARGGLDEGIALLREGLRHDPDHVAMNNNLAWVLATAGPDTLRDGAAALRLARRALEASGGDDPAVLDTVAAAWAELGRFDHAIDHATRAVDRARAAGRNELARQIADRVKLYRSGQPYRER